MRKLARPDRPRVAAILAADRTFRDEEIAVALELVDSALKTPEQGYRVLVLADDGGVAGVAVPSGREHGGTGAPSIDRAEGAKARGPAPPGRDASVIEGYVCYGRTPMTDHTYDLYWIVTHPSARGRGVASRLLRALEDQILAESGAIVRIETSQQEGYDAARAFYEKRGYREVGRIPDFYRANDDLIVLSKRLAPAVR